MTLDDIGRIMVEWIRQQMRDDGRNASGVASQSLQYQIVDGRRIQITGIDYWTFVEDGRRPGKRPPIGAIMDWVAAKGITIVVDGKVLDDKSAAFAIANTIAREGVQTRGSRSKFGNKLKPAERAIEERGAELRQLISRWAREQTEERINELIAEFNAA